MKKRILFRVLSLSLALILSLGLLVGLTVFQGRTVTEYGKATEFVTGEYSLVVAGITPTNMPNGDYAMYHGLATNPGFLFGAFNASSPGNTPVWKVTRISDTQCTIQNTSKGANGYVNMAADYIGYGPEMKLNYIFSGGRIKFYVTVGGQNWYIRFTNSNRNESRFHAGTSDGSNLFNLYGNITTEVPDPIVIPPVTGEPLLKLACISDLHADYGLQSQAPYIRNSTLKVVDAISRYENADILISGGDNTSDNAGVSNKGGWTPATFAKVMEQYRYLSDHATESGNALWVAGNHDFQAGEDEGYDSYADFVKLMEEANGAPLSVYRQKNDSTVASGNYPDYVLGLHYNIKGFDFIIINAPYGQAKVYSEGTYSWLSQRLQSIGKDKTVFLLTHYPLTDGRNISTPNYGVSGTHYNKLTGILKNYPNLIYLHGHDHGSTDSVYINSDTFERITSYTPSGAVVNDRNVVPTSFITAFMGSMSYYNYSTNKGGLTAADPSIVQALMITVYWDRVVFQMKNYGTALADVTPLSWTVMRDIADPPSGSSSSTSTVASSSQGRPSGDWDVSDSWDDNSDGGMTDDVSEDLTDSDSVTDTLASASSSPSGEGAVTDSGEDVSSSIPSESDDAGPTGTSPAPLSSGTASDPASGEEGFPLWAVILISAGGVLLLGGAATGMLLYARQSKGQSSGSDPES